MSIQRSDFWDLFTEGIRQKFSDVCRGDRRLINDVMTAFLQSHSRSEKQREKISDYDDDELLAEVSATVISSGIPLKRFFKLVQPTIKAIFDERDRIDWQERETKNQSGPYRVVSSVWYSGDSPHRGKPQIVWSGTLKELCDTYPRNKSVEFGMQSTGDIFWALWVEFFENGEWTTLSVDPRPVEPESA